MPIDASIPLTGATEPSNPLGMISSFADTQNKLNQNRLFQQTYAARQRMGQIFATSPDTETAWNTIMQDPQVAPFAGDALSSWRAAQLSMTQQQGEQQKQAVDGYHAFMQWMPAIAADPSMAPYAAQSTLKLLSPYAAPRVQAAISDAWTALTGGLPADPDSARAEFGKRAAGMVLSGGFGPEVNKAIYGTPNITDVGGTLQPTLTLPPQLGGSSIPSGQALPKSLAPTVVTGPYGPGGAQRTSTIGGGNPLAPSGRGGAGANPLVGPSMEQTGAFEGAGKTAGDISAEMADNLKNMPVLMKRLDMLNGALSQFQAGGGADIRSNVGQLMQFLRNAGFSGISDDLIQKVANGSLPATQVFNSNIKPFVISELKAAAQGTGRVMRSEVDSFLSMLSVNTDPRAILQILNQTRYAAQVAYDQSNKFVQFKNLLAKDDPSVAGLGPSDFYGWWTNLPARQMPTGTPSGSMTFGPKGTAGVKGADSGPQPAAAGGLRVTHRYNQNTGQMVPVGGGQ